MRRWTPGTTTTPFCLSSAWLATRIDEDGRAVIEISPCLIKQEDTFFIIRALIPSIYRYGYGHARTAQRASGSGLSCTCPTYDCCTSECTIGSRPFVYHKP